MYWQRSPNSSKQQAKQSGLQTTYGGREGTQQLTQQIIQQQKKLDEESLYGQEETISKSDRLKTKIDNLKNKVDRKEGTIEQYQNQINELMDIINDMKDQNNFKTPIRNRNRSVYNAQPKEPNSINNSSLNNGQLNTTRTQDLNRRRMSQSIDQNGTKVIDSKISIDSNTMRNTQSVSFQEVASFKKRILSLEIQNETLEQISEILKHKNETLEKEVKHLKEIIIDPEKKPDVLRELKLRETEDKKYNLEQQMKLMHTQYEYTIQQQLEEKALSDNEIQILRKQINQIHEQQPSDHSQQLGDLVKLVDDMKTLMQKKNEQIEKLQYKNEILEKNQRQLSLNVSPQKEKEEYDQYSNPEKVSEIQKDLLKPILKTQNHKCSNENDKIDKELPVDQSKTNEDLLKLIEIQNSKNDDLESIIVSKNEEIEEQEKIAKQKLKIINEAYETIRTYYTEVIHEANKKEELIENLTKAQQNENKDMTQLCQVLRDLLLQKESQQLIAKQEILDQDKSIQKLKEELKYMEQKNKQEHDKQNKDQKANQEKISQLEQNIVSLKKLLQDKENELKLKTISLEQQNIDLKNKVKEQIELIDNLGSANQDNIQKIKQENHQNFEQNKQLLAVINEKEKEIAHLRLKFQSLEEEVKKLRKRNIGLKNQIDSSSLPLKTQSTAGYGKDPDLYTKKNASREQSPYLRNSIQSYGGNQSQRIETISSTTPIPHTLKTHGITPLNKNNIMLSKNQMLPSNPSIYQNSPQQSINFPPPNNNANPFLKIKYIRTLKEWFQYWTNYSDNTTFKFQLLERMSHTEKLKDEFSKSPEMKMRVFKDALESQNYDMYEQAIQIMADILDLNKLSDKELEYISNGHVAVRCLRGPRSEEDLNDYHNVHMAGLKVLSYMNQCNLNWTSKMTEEFQNVQAMKLLISYIRQYEKEWPKLLSFNVLLYMAKNKVLINQMIGSDIQQTLIINLEENNQELLSVNLNLFGHLLQIDQFKQTLKEDPRLMKLLSMLFDNNNSTLSGTLLCISFLLPQYSFNRGIFKENIIERISQIGTKSPYPLTRSNALTLIKRICEHGDERDVNILNVYGGGDLVINLELEEEENLKENKLAKERIIKTLKIYEYIIEHSVVKDEINFIKKLLKLFSNKQIKQEPKIEKNVLQIIHQLWDKMEGNMVDFLVEPTVLSQIIEGYIESETNQDIASYGLMLVGVCERENMNTFILDRKGEELMESLFTNIKHTDYKIAYTALKIISFLAQEIKSLLFVNESHLEKLVSVLKRENLDEEYIAFGLDSIFYLLKQYQSMQMLIDYGIIDILLNIIEESIYQYPVICKAFSCIEMIQTLYQEQNILKKYVIQQSKEGSQLIINIAQTCMNKEIGINSAYFWRFLANESLDNQFITFIFDRAENFIEYVIRVQKLFQQITPEISTDCLTILHNLSNRSQQLKEIVKYQINRQN